MIVVTGGAGFIGSNLVAALEERGAGPLAVCDTFGRDEKWRNLAKRQLAHLVAPEGLAEFLRERRREIAMVFHLGAVSSTTETDVDLIVDSNFRLSQRLWAWCAESGARFVYASSAATYGDGAAGFDDDSTAAGLARLRPLNAYGWSKHLFDRWVAAQLAARAARPPQHVGLKFFNVYGPNEYHKGGQRSVVHQIHPVAAAGETFSLFKSHDPAYPDGGQLRDFVWVGDCADVMLWLADHPEVSGLFNLGTGTARSFLDLATAVYRALGRNARIAYRDMPEALRAKYQYFTQARMERLRAAGYRRPFTAIEDGVARYVRDHLSAADPYR